MPWDEFKEIMLKGTKGELQLLGERFTGIKQVKAMLEYYGSATNLLEASRWDAVELMKLVAYHCPSFRDVAKYKGFEVPFYKRLQILASDIDLMLKEYGGGLPSLRGVELLTAFADYKLPQFFRHFRVFLYSDELTSLIGEMALIPAGSEMEVEIRAWTILAVELISDALGLIPRDVDNLIWEAAQDITFSEPYHRTLTIYY